MEIMRGPFRAAVLASLVYASSLFAQHGVIREYAALAPQPDAAALKPLFDASLTDTSICVGPDRAYYLTGSSVAEGRACASGIVDIWRSTDMRDWRKLRTLDFGQGRFVSPEIHWLKNTFWLTLGHEGGGTELLRFQSADLAASGFERKPITPRGIDPSVFLDDDGTFCLVMGGGEIAPMRTNSLDGLLKSTSGRAEGPYELAFPENRGVDQQIDASLFQDIDGSRMERRRESLRWHLRHDVRLLEEPAGTLQTTAGGGAACAPRRAVPGQIGPLERRIVRQRPHGPVSRHAGLRPGRDHGQGRRSGHSSRPGQPGSKVVLTKCSNQKKGGFDREMDTQAILEGSRGHVCGGGIAAAICLDTNGRLQMRS